MDNVATIRTKNVKNVNLLLKLQKLKFIFLQHIFIIKMILVFIYNTYLYRHSKQTRIFEPIRKLAVNQHDQYTIQ